MAWHPEDYGSPFAVAMRATWRAVHKRYPNGISATDLLHEMRAAGYNNAYVNVLDVADALAGGAIPELVRP